MLDEGCRASKSNGRSSINRCTQVLIADSNLNLEEHSPQRRLDLAEAARITERLAGRRVRRREGSVLRLPLVLQLQQLLSLERSSLRLLHS